MNVPDPDAPWIRRALLLGWEPWRIEDLAQNLDVHTEVVLVRYEGIALRIQRHAGGDPVFQILTRTSWLEHTVAMRHALARAGLTDAWLTISSLPGSAQVRMPRT